MALIDLAARRIRVRIVYWGPAGSGKTTNLRRIAAAVPAAARGDLIALARGDGRTLFLDELLLALGEVGGWDFRLRLFSVPGQPDFGRTRAAVLAGADGVVFVADSDPARQPANLESLNELERTLADAGRALAEVPLVLQLNKRDLSKTVPEAQLRLALGLQQRPAFAAVATAGMGVLPALRAVCKLVAAGL